jgi:hypothetical protein
LKRLPVKREYAAALISIQINFKHLAAKIRHGQSFSKFKYPIWLWICYFAIFSVGDYFRNCYAIRFAGDFHLAVIIASMCLDNYRII